MTFLLIVGIIALVAVVLIQLGRVSELSAAIRGGQDAQLETNNFHAAFGMFFMVAFLVGVVWSFYHYYPTFLGYGVNVAASKHGASVDMMFNITLIVTGIVFFITQVLLFYYGWKYRDRGNTRAAFWAHDTRLEIIWMAIPAVAMTFLVVAGINAWNKSMADIGPNEVIGQDYMEIEATGYQFGWTMRYPGPDNNLGTKNFRLISGDNPLGQDWNDARNFDDILSQGGDTIKLPVNKKVRVRITAKDVLHNFYLPQFRVKMDAVPGMPTYFVFTPTITTDSMRYLLSKRPEWQTVVTDANGNQMPRWKTFVYELACAELCGKGHFSMRRVIDVVTQSQYDQWIAQQKSYYYTTINPAADPNAAPVDTPTGGSTSDATPPAAPEKGAKL